MTTIVVDASVVLQACVEEAGFGILAEYQIAAPYLVRSESLSSLREATYRGEISAELASQYALAYASSNKRRDGQWRSISIRMPLGLDARGLPSVHRSMQSTKLIGR